jgi:YHYH protein
MKTILTPVVAGLAGIFLIATTARADDPRTNSWFTTYAGKYARIYTNNMMLAAGTALTNWSNGAQTQSLPAYCGVQEVYSSSNWIYVRSTGLASFTMGPWQNGAFPNLPVNQKVLFRFPRTNGVPAAKSLTGAGQIGIFADGVEMFNSWDAFTWSTVSNTDAQNITGYWNRDAYVNEGVTFDPGYAHQQQGGTYHYHAEPIALRYQLGDHVDYNSATKTYSEDTSTPTKHSPILAWTADGFPVYGPYGYSVATNANSGIRRMISGYVLRNGQDGTDNLPVTGRNTIPQWAVRLYGVSSNQVGAPFTGIHTNGCYMEDNDYLGDHGYVQGTDFDLDEYNGRWCVTPEFPGGTYAYFVAINSNGTPVYPYNIGRGYFGSPAGGAVTAIMETVVTNFLGNTNLASKINSPGVNNGTVTLSWSAIEGGSYQVEATTNLASSSGWTILGTGISPNQTLGSYTNVTTLDKRFYRVGRNSVANFDDAGTTFFATNSVAPGGSAYRGQTVNLTITLTSPPNLPPAGAPVTSVTVGGITNLSATCTASGTVVSLFTIPSGTSSTNAQNVVVTFGIPPGQSQAPTFTLTGGFTINP